MAKIHYGKVAASGYAATTAQTGYGAANLGSEQIGVPYRATGLGATDLTITFAAPTPVQSLFLHDVNFASATIEKSPDAVTFVGVGVATFAAGNENRYRGVITVNDASVRALKVKISAGASLDGLGFWRVGAAYPWASALTIPSPFQNGYRARFIRPRVRADLVNGRSPEARIGVPFHIIEVPFKPKDDESLRQVAALSDAATVLLDLGLANYPAQLWPAYLLSDEVAESFGMPKVSDLTLTYKEVV